MKVFLDLLLSLSTLFLSYVVHHHVVTIEKQYMWGGVAISNTEIVWSR